MSPEYTLNTVDGINIATKTAVEINVNNLYLDFGDFSCRFFLPKSQHLRLERGKRPGRSLGKGPGYPLVDSKYSPCSFFKDPPRNRWGINLRAA